MSSETAPPADWLAHDRARLAGLLATVTVQATEVLAGLDGARVGHPDARVQRDPLTLPVAGLGADAALTLLRRRWLDTFSASAGPRYLGFVTGGATPAALAADWLTSLHDNNLVSGGESSAPDLAREAVDLFRQLLGLPATFEGAVVTGATTSTITALATARQWIGEQRDVDVSVEGVAALGPVPVLSGTPHASIAKALSVIGLGRASLTRVQTVLGREAVDPDALERALQQLADEGRGPAIVVANLGTVNTCDVDDLVAVADACELHGAWLHADAAFGGVAAASPRRRPLLAGWERADSITVDAHKWLNVPYDGAIVLTRHLQLQGRVMRSQGAYLPAEVHAGTPWHLTPENSQRVRALPIWATLVAYGRVGYEEVVERCMAHAIAFGQAVYDHPLLELLAPVRLNGVCFAIRTLDGGSTRDQAATRQVLDRLTAEGQAFLTPTVLDGRAAVRASFTNWRTSDDDVQVVLAALDEALAAR